MDQLSSNEFRKTFARLTVPVLVTVHGHPIGTYTPVRAISGTTPIDEVPPLSMALLEPPERRKLVRLAESVA